MFIGFPYSCSQEEVLQKIHATAQPLNLRKADREIVAAAIEQCPGGIPESLLPQPLNPKPVRLQKSNGPFCLL